MDILSLTSTILFTSERITVKEALREAVLRRANLHGADLHGAYLHGAMNAAIAIARLQFIPETGSFEAWKLCKSKVLVKLLIPESAMRSHGTERKCRASEAVVFTIIYLTKSAKLSGSAVTM